MNAPHGILLTREAQASFRAIVARVARRDSALQARRVAQALRDKVGALAKFPERYERFHVANTGRLRYRQFFALEYRLVYSIDEGRRMLIVHAIDRAVPGD